MRFALVIGLVACSGAATPPAESVRRSPGAPAVEVTLYREHAAVHQRFTVEIGASLTGSVELEIAAGIEAGDVYLLPDPAVSLAEVTSDDEVPDEAVLPDDAGDGDDELPTLDRTAAATRVVAHLRSRRPGRFAITLGYDTRMMAWQASYRLALSENRTSGALRGSLAIENLTELAFPRTALWLVDAEHGAPAARLAERRGDQVFGHDGKPLLLGALALGTVSIITGTSKLPLLAPASVPLRRGLVFDPIGTALDHPGTSPLRERSFGAAIPAATIHETLELPRTRATRTRAPAGPVELDGATALPATLFGAASREAAADSIPLAPATGVTARRERRELTIDDERRRVSEEFVITLHNTRATPVTVTVREHLYRGLNWTLAYHSLPQDAVVKEGPQQIAMRAAVPARRGTTRGELKVLYVVVYTW